MRIPDCATGEISCATGEWDGERELRNRGDILRNRGDILRNRGNFLRNRGVETAQPGKFSAPSALKHGLFGPTERARAEDRIPKGGMVGDGPRFAGATRTRPHVKMQSSSSERLEVA